MARKAFCTGCQETFGKMHQMINHRRTHRCGGRFLPPEARALVDDMRLKREAVLRKMRQDDKTEAEYQ